MEYKIEDLTKEEAGYIGEKINEIVPRETDADEEEFVLKVENENGVIIGGCVATAYEYHWSRVLLDDLWVDERYRHHGIGSVIIREVERIAKEKGCRVVTLGTASYMARPFYEKHGYTVFTTLKKPNGYVSYSLVKYLDNDAPEYLPTDNSGSRFKVSLGSDDDAEVILNGLDAYSAAYEQECESVGFYKKLVDKKGGFSAGVIADADKGETGFVDALFVEEPLRHQGLGTYLLEEAEKFAKENGASMVMTNAGDWNVGFFKKNGYLLRGELKDVPKGHDCYELYKKFEAPEADRQIPAQQSGLPPKDNPEVVAHQPFALKNVLNNSRVFDIII
ncbi:MAG: GNAT family N-acetyltransferase [Clostridia bacterium]|nr:GNAT family N-acetyltransferase [Clostridia bacterium]